jgi:hypothetical protein
MAWKRASTGRGSMPPQITSFEPHARQPDSFRKPRQGDLILFSQILSIRNEGRLCQEGVQAPCCTRDEGGPFGAALQGEVSNSHKLLRTQGRGGERYGKGVTMIASCVDWRDERKRTSDDASKHSQTTPKPGSTPCSGINAWKIPAYCPCGVRCRGGVTPIWALVRNLRTWSAMPREKTQVAKSMRSKVPIRRPGADSSVVAMKWGNVCGAKGGGRAIAFDRSPPQRGGGRGSRHSIPRV